MEPTDSPPTEPTDSPPTEPTDSPPTEPTDSPPTEPTDEARTHLVRERAFRVARWVGVATISAVLLAFGVAVLERIIYSGDVMPGIRVAGVEVGGDSEAALRQQLTGIADRLATKTIKVRAADIDLSANPSEFDLSIDVESTLRAARRAGRSGNPFEQVAGMFQRRFESEEVDLPIEIDEATIGSVLKRWQERVDRDIENGALQFEGTDVVAVESKPGRRIDMAAARAALLTQLRRVDRQTVELPVETVTPPVSATEVARAASAAREVLSGSYTVRRGSNRVVIRPSQIALAMSTKVDRTRLQLVIDPAILGAAVGEELLPITTPAVDARFEITSANTVQVVPSVDGQIIDMEAAIQRILRGRRRFPAPMRVLTPDHDTKWANDLGITEMVSTFTTYHDSGQARVVNIHRAADLMNNTIVEPGEEFSLNDTVGPRTEERGFVPAPVYYEGFTEDFGGGVSQIATTTFNAVFWGGYEDIYHKPHSVYFTRYPMGREATVNYDTVDLRFRNDTNYGVLVRASYSDTSITVSFYGNNEGRVVKEVASDCESASSASRCVDILEELPVETDEYTCPSDPTQVLRVDSDNVCASLGPGQRATVNSGHTGYRVEYTQVIEQEGQEPQRRTYRWDYVMDPNIVVVGRGSTPPPADDDPADTTSNSETTDTTDTTAPG